jgi:hypothetical protein
MPPAGPAGRKGGGLLTHESKDRAGGAVGIEGTLKTEKYGEMRDGSEVVRSMERRTPSDPIDSFRFFRALEQCVQKAANESF